MSGRRARILRKVALARKLSLAGYRRLKRYWTANKRLVDVLQERL